jgi:hypothetical protein
MGKTRKDRVNQVLILILSILLLVGVGLAIGNIILVNHSNPNTPSQDNAQSDVTTSTTPMTEEEQAKFNHFQNQYKEITEAANAILSKEDVVASDILEIYNPVINQYLNEGDYSDAQIYILWRNDNLLSKGFKKEALDALKSVDWSIFPDNLKHRHYQKIVDLAKEIGDNETVAEYEALVASTPGMTDEQKKAAAERMEKMRSNPTALGGE